MQQTFGKESKLKSKTEIKQIFTKKHSFKNYPLTLHINYFASSHSELKFVISAPKRLFKRAHDRNRIKRLMREAIRKNKVSLTHFLEKNNIVLYVFAIYHADKEAKIENIESSIKNLFIKIENEIVSKISN